MSNEKTVLNSSVLNEENRSSHANYDEFINSVKESKESYQSVPDVQATAEEEVVAMLLSAMMEGIVKDWKIQFIPTRKTFTEQSSEDINFDDQNVCFKSTTEPHTSVATLGTHKSLNKVELFASRKETMERTRTATSERVVSSGSLFEDIFRSTEEGENVKVSSINTKNQIKDGEEENSLAQLQILRDFIAKENFYGSLFMECEYEFNIKFKQGNRYEGKLRNCRMHGEGKFYWADGSIYEGEFYLGKMTGKGKLSWPDGSWYEGELCKGFRHGRGLYVSAPTFYAGYWKCGRRHGLGAMFYNHFDTSKYYYNGEWSGDKKHGTGLRCYPSGAMYSGQWMSGKRHGLGTMVWTNRDVYSGNFRRGKMHGYGEYTWDTFFGRQLVVAEENCYYGNWANNVRHGNGTLETTTGVVVKGRWKNGKKHGPAEVICSNGNFLYSDDLFEEDNLCLPNNKFEEDSLMDASLQSLYNLPVSAPCHEINMGYYVDRLIEYINECNMLGKPFGSTTSRPTVPDTKRTFSFNRSFEPEENKFEFKQEENHTRNVLMQFLSTLKVVYNTYSQVCCDDKPSFPTVLMRLMWWQLLRDCDLQSRGLSLADFDVCIANNKACLVQGVHYPFERLLFWQFLHCLVEVSWQLYGKKCVGTPSVKGVIAAGLHKLITCDLIPNAGHHKGNALFSCRDMMSFDALYWYYRGLGEPLPAREFLKQAAESQENVCEQDSVPKYFEHQIRGKNIIGVGGKLAYFPKEEPFLGEYKYLEEDPSHPRNLSFLSKISLHSILECILKICPSISSGNLLVNMDYKFVFLEFYEIFILCASKLARSKILERQKKYEEEESKSISPENTVVEEPPTPKPEEDLPKSKRKKSSGEKKAKKKPTKKLS